MLGAFVVSRVWLVLAGVRFDATTLPYFWQFLDPSLLRHDLLRSVWYLHSQPPLYNLWLGVSLKMFGSQFSPAVHLEYLAMGVAIAIILVTLLERITGSVICAAGVASLFVLNPAVVLYENWLFYEYPVTCMLLIAAVALDQFVRSRSTRWAVVFFTTDVLIVFTRSTFQVPWLILVVVLTVWLMPHARRTILLFGCTSLIVVSLLSVKNYIEFGAPLSSSWSGMNLAQVAFADLSPTTRRALVDGRTLTQISAIPPFSALDRYGRAFQNTRPTGIPALDAPAKASGARNLNNIAYVQISRRYLDDSLRLIWARPDIYLRGVADGLKLFATPSADLQYLDRNRSKIRHWNGLFDRAVFLRLPRPVSIYLGIVLAYFVAMVYGSHLFARRIRRGCDPIDRGLAVLLFAWCTVMYVTAVTAFGEVSENQRLRFCLDPLVVLLVAAAMRRLAYRVKTTRAQRVPGTTCGLSPSLYSS